MDGVQSGCSVKTKKGIAGDFPAQDSFPMFKSAKYWIVVYWGVTLPMDTWAICFYTDHWSAHHGPNSALRTLPLSEISEVYLEPKTSAYFRIYRGKEVTQCTPIATTLAAALWADAIFAVLQLHNDHDIKIIKDHFQGYQAFVHANRKSDGNEGEFSVSTGPPRTKRQSIFGKMKEIFSSSYIDTSTQQENISATSPTNQNSSGANSASEGVVSSEGEQLKSPGRSSRAIRRWTTAVGGAFLNRSKGSEDASANAASATEESSSKRIDSGGHDIEASSKSSMFFSSSPNRRTATNRRDSRSQSSESVSQGFLSQSVTDFHRPDSSSSLRQRASFSSSGDETRSQQFEEDKREETEDDELRSRFTDSINSKRFSMDNVGSSTLPTATAAAGEEGEGAGVAIGVNQGKLTSSAGLSSSTTDKAASSPTNPAVIMPEPRSIHERLRVVAAYSSGDERKKPFKNDKKKQSDTPGYFSDTNQIRHGVKSPVPTQTSSSRQPQKLRIEAEEQVTRPPPVVQQPRPPAAELGQFTVLDMLYAQNMAVKQQLLTKVRQGNNSCYNRDRDHEMGEDEDFNNRLKANSPRKSPSNRHEPSSFSSQRRGMVSPSNAEDALYPTYVENSSSRAKESPSKHNREKLLSEFLTGDFSTSFSVFAKSKDPPAAVASPTQPRGTGLQRTSSQLDDHNEAPVAKRQKGYLARAFSGHTQSLAAKDNISKASLTSIFRYGKDRSNSATTDDEESPQRILQKSKSSNNYSARTFLAMKKSKSQSAVEEQETAAPAPSVQEKREPKRSSSSKKKSNKSLSNNSTETVSQQDRPLELCDLVVDDDVERESSKSEEKDQTEDRDSMSSSFSHKQQMVPPLPSLTAPNELQKDEEGDVSSPPAPEHRLFKVFSNQNSASSPSALLAPSQITPSKIQLPGVTSPLLEVDSQEIQGMLSQLEQMREKYSRRPVHDKISLEKGMAPIATDEIKDSQSNTRPQSVLHSSSHNKTPYQDSATSSSLQQLVPRTSPSSSPSIPSHQSPGTSYNRAISPMNQRPTASTNTAGSPTGHTRRVGRHYSTGSILSANELKTTVDSNSANNYHHSKYTTQSKVPSGFPFPFSTTIQATLAGHAVTVTLLSHSELRQKLLSRPNLIPMRPGLQMSPIKQRPTQASSGLLSSQPPQSSSSLSLVSSPSSLLLTRGSIQDAINQTTSPGHGASAQSARQKYLRQQQQERESLEVTALTMMAIAAELLDAECYLGISRVSNILATNIQGVNPHGGVENQATESLLQDIVEEYLYIPMGRIMTLDVDESRSGLFRFSLSSMECLLRTEAAMGREEVHKKKGLTDACLYLRSFDLIPSESILLSLFSSVLGVSHSALRGTTTGSISPSDTAIGGSHAWRKPTSASFEEAGGSSVGQRYNHHRVPQVKDPKRKISVQQQQHLQQQSLNSSASALSSESSLPSQQLTIGNATSDYVPCVLKANSPEILPAFLQTLLHLRQTVTL